ncbi:MAG: hypothetical protein RLZZ623_1634, partial [Actinomycetota bacterium]
MSRRRDTKTKGVLRYRYRLIISMLVVSIPLMAVLAVLLTTRSSASLTREAEHGGVNVARAVTVRLEDWLSERHEDLAVLADELGAAPHGPEAEAALHRVQASAGDFALLEVTDLNGAITVSDGEHTVDVSKASWFRTAAGGEVVSTSPVAQDNAIDWVITQPILDAAGQPVAVLVGDLAVTELPTVLNPELDEGSQVLAVDSGGLLVYATSMGAVPDEATLLASGSLSTVVDNAGVTRAAQVETGSASYTDLAGDAVVAGFDNVDEVGWVILAEANRDTLLAPVHEQRRQALIFVIVGSVLAAIAAFVLAQVEARKLRSFAEEARTAGVEVNSAASELSASSDELAATTTQQSAAVTQASATTEE